MLKHVVAVEALEPYRLRLVFEDGVSGRSTWRDWFGSRACSRRSAIR